MSGHWPDYWGTLRHVKSRGGRKPYTMRRLCRIDYSLFIDSLFDGSLINNCPLRAYFLANSDTGAMPLSAASRGEFT
jgi:hypothetical protein